MRFYRHSGTVASGIRAYIPVCLRAAGRSRRFLVSFFLFETRDNELMNLVRANEKVASAELPVHVINSDSHSK
jgi:hypothetical protein